MFFHGLLPLRYSSPEGYFDLLAYNLSSMCCINFVKAHELATRGAFLPTK